MQPTLFRSHHPLNHDQQPQAVLLLAYGGPESLNQVADFVRHIRGGRPTPDRLIDEVTERYRVIGGGSPLLRVTNSTARQLQQTLNKPVYVGMRHNQPFIRDVLGRMARDDITSCTVICMAPHHSNVSIGAYHKALEQGLQDLGYDLRYAFVRAWHRHPRLIRLWTDALRTTLTKAGVTPATLTQHHRVLFSAHSLPLRGFAPTASGEKANPRGGPPRGWLRPFASKGRVGQKQNRLRSSKSRDDTYSRQLRQTAELIALHTPLKPDRWECVFQSAGASGDAWLGPDICDRLAQLAQQNIRRVVVAPIGFLAEHVEVLYDLDHEARAIAAEHGITLTRAPMPNDHPDLIATLKDLVLGSTGLNGSSDVG
ncbi:MAG: ferrochelatase [Myxococcota bacterium]